MGILIEGTSLAANFLRENTTTLAKVREETIKLLAKANMWFFSPEQPALTEEAQRVLDWAVDKKKKYGDSGEITTSHLLVGIWYEGESKELESSSTKPGFMADDIFHLSSLICDANFFINEGNSDVIQRENDFFLVFNL